MADDRAVGARIRRARQERGLTIAALAERVGLSRPFLSQIESGARNGTLAHITAIAVALDKPVHALLGREAKGRSTRLFPLDHDAPPDPIEAGYGLTHNPEVRSTTLSDHDGVAVFRVENVRLLVGAAPAFVCMAVISGSGTWSIVGSPPIRLGPGDCATYSPVGGQRIEADPGTALTYVCTIYAL